MTSDKNAECFVDRDSKIVDSKIVVNIIENVWMSVEKQLDARANDYVV